MFSRILSDNLITRIEPRAFEGVTVSLSLTLQSNPLQDLWPHSFTDVSVAEDLYLSELEFTKIPTKALYSVSARTIYFDSGGIENIEPEALYDVTVTEDM